MSAPVRAAKPSVEIRQLRLQTKQTVLVALAVSIISTLQGASDARQAAIRETEKAVELRNSLATIASQRVRDFQTLIEHQVVETITVAAIKGALSVEERLIEFARLGKIQPALFQINIYRMAGGGAILFSRRVEALSALESSLTPDSFGGKFPRYRPVSLDLQNLAVGSGLFSDPTDGEVVYETHFYLSALNNILAQTTLGTNTTVGLVDSFGNWLANPNSSLVLHAINCPLVLQSTYAYLIRRSGLPTWESARIKLLLQTLIGACFRYIPTRPFLLTPSITFRKRPHGLLLGKIWHH